MPLSIERVVELLSQSEEGHVFPDELRGKRYVVVHGLDPDSMRDPPDEDDAFYEKAKDWIGLRVVGEVADIEGALRLLWESIEALKRQFTPDEEQSGDSWQEQLTKWLEEGPWGVPDDEIAAATDFGINLAKEMFPISRYEFAVYGEAPYEGESAAILELPPKVTLAGKSKNLFAACRKNDIERVRELIAKGTDVRVADVHGDSPLHHAVGHRNREMVECLLDAGADPDASLRFGHAPVFAKRVSRGRTMPATNQFDDENHFGIACLLVDRGASPSSTRPNGQTLVDVAANGLPMNERWVRHFMGFGVSSSLLRTSGVHRRPLDNLLSALHFRSAHERARIPDKVRLLGWLGCDPNETTNTYGKTTPVEEWLTMGYSENEVEPAVIVGIARAFVEIGARDDVGISDERRPSERAEMWGKRDGMHHYAEAARILRSGREPKA